MDSFKFAIYSLSITVFVAVVWAGIFANINVNDQSILTLVNGITASTSVIVGFSGTIIGIMFRDVDKKHDNEARMFFFKAIAVLMIPLTMLWTVYSLLATGGAWSSIAVRWGLSGLIMAFYVFSAVVIFFAKRLSAEIENKSEEMESNESEADKKEQEKEEPKEQLVTIRGVSRNEIKTNELETSKEQRQRDKLIYDIILNRYDLEWKRNNDLDSKASGVVGFAGLLATLSAGIIQFVSNPSYRPLALFAINSLHVICVLRSFGIWARKI